MSNISVCPNAVPPLNVVWGTVPLNVAYLFVGAPYFLFIFIYDELRKVRPRCRVGEDACKGLCAWEGKEGWGVELACCTKGV